MQAVILAAGLGSRIREFHSLPKGFITLDEKPIIQESIEKLRACGVTQIAIITGYNSAYYESFAAEKDFITLIFNPHYSEFGSLYSLYCAKNWVKGDFLVLESDIVYEQKAIEKIIHDGEPNSILLSGKTHSGDEVYVQTRDQKLIRMSKDKNHLESDEIFGEFVGINKLSLRDYRQLIHQLEQNPVLLQAGHYEEQGIVAMTAFTDVSCLKIDDLLWGEIDNVTQYERAKQLHCAIENHSCELT